MKVAESEKEEWQLLAKSHQVSLSELIREKLKNVKSVKKRKVKTVDPELLRAINSIGNNINQISRPDVWKWYVDVVYIKYLELSCLNRKTFYIEKSF